MVKAMPDPFIPKHSTVYWYRQRVPKDVISAAAGRSVSVNVDGVTRPLKVGAALKVSLGTKDPAQAKLRARDVQDQFDLIWASFRSDEVTLSFKQAVALAGEVYRDWAALEDNPGSPGMWARVRAENADAKVGRPYRHPLTIGPIIADPMEDRFGPLVDVVLNRHQLRVTQESRRMVLEQTAKALDDVAKLLEKRADGDYRPDPVRERFPDFAINRKPVVSTTAAGITFEQIIAAEDEHRRLGLGAKYKPLPAATKRKYLSIANEFAGFRGAYGNRADTVSAEDYDKWKVFLLRERSGNRARTVHYKMGAIKTLLGWGVKRFKTNQGLAVALDAIRAVELPGYEKKPSDITAIRLDEALQVLRAARRETDVRTRWLPWLCAYSGARINELTPLEPDDFRQVDGHWFYKIHSGGKRSVKNTNSVRYVPVHPALVSEGLLDFVQSVNGRLFRTGASDKVQDWFRHPKGAGITRDGVAPSHGWRHLFEDLCIRDGVSDGAKKYITGRAKGGSDEDYGKTDALLPGLAREIAKIVPFGL